MITHGSWFVPLHAHGITTVCEQAALFCREQTCRGGAFPADRVGRAAQREGHADAVAGFVAQYRTVAAEAVCG